VWDQQRDALAHITGKNDLAIVVGYAGTGKSTMLGVARDEWERAGYQVRGAALSGIAAEGLEGGSGIQSRTIASMEYQWGQGRELPGPRDVLVIDEAGMIGTRQMERVLSEAERAGAKVVLVGDAEQLQAIEAGAAFRALAERHGAAEINEVRRQHEDWQRDATRALATAAPARRSMPMSSTAWSTRPRRARRAGRADRHMGRAAPRRSGQDPDHPHPHQCRGARFEPGRARSAARRRRVGAGRAYIGGAGRARLRQRRPHHVPQERARHGREERHAGESRARVARQHGRSP
jgi:hypothetical protein